MIKRKRENYQFSCQVGNVKKKKNMDLFSNNKLSARFKYNPLISSQCIYVSGHIEITFYDDIIKDDVSCHPFVHIIFSCGTCVRHVYHDGTGDASIGDKKLFLKEMVKNVKSINITMNIFYDYNGGNDYLIHQAIRERLQHEKWTLYDKITENGDVTLIMEESKQNENYNSKTMTSKVYKTLLRNASEVFDRMFDHKVQESHTGIIKIDCNSQKIIDELIYWSIFQQIKTIECDYLELFKVAHCYKFDLLMNICLNELIDNINENNFVILLNLFEEYKMKADTLTDALYVKIVKWYKKEGFHFEFSDNAIPISFRNLVIHDINKDLI